MALTLLNGVRNAMADAMDGIINTGSGTSVMQLETFDDIEVATFSFQNPAFGAASSGIITLLGTTLSDTSATGGLVAQYSIYDRDAAKVLEGVVATGGADLSLTSLNIGATDTVELTAFSIEVPA